MSVVGREDTNIWNKRTCQAFGHVKGKQQVYVSHDLLPLNQLTKPTKIKLSSCITLGKEKNM